jgi:hypothetical protein
MISKSTLLKLPAIVIGAPKGSLVLNMDLQLMTIQWKLSMQEVLMLSRGINVSVMFHVKSST